MKALEIILSIIAGSSVILLAVQITLYKRLRKEVDELLEEHDMIKHEEYYDPSTGTYKKKSINWK